MATLYAGGGRRSASPTYTPLTPNRATANNAAPTLDEQFRAGIAANTLTTGPLQVSEAIQSSGMGSTPAGLASGGINISDSVGRFGNFASTLGNLSGNSGLAGVGSVLGLAGALGQTTTPSQGFAALAGPALSLVGAPGGVVSLGQAALTGNSAMAIDSVVGLLNPTVGAVNLLAGLLGLPTLGTAINGKGNKPLTMDRGPGGSSGDPDAAAMGEGPGGLTTASSDNPGSEAMSILGPQSTRFGNWGSNRNSSTFGGSYDAMNANLGDIGFGSFNNGNTTFGGGSSGSVGSGFGGNRGIGD